MRGDNTEVMSGTSQARAGATATDDPGGDRLAADATDDGDDPQFVTVGGNSVAYATYGDPTGEPVVFFHGTPGSRLLGDVYDDVARSNGVRVLAFDRPGYGRSAAWQEFTLSDSGAVLAAILDDVGVEDAGLVAFSGGTPHAFAAVDEHPDRVRGVEVVSGGVPASMRESTPTPQRVLGRLAATTPRLFSGLLRGQAWVARHLPPSFVVAQYTTNDGLDEVPDGVAATVKRDFVEAVGERRAGVRRESRQFTDDWAVSPAAVDCPVRWWHGEQDSNAPLDGAERMAAALPDCDLRVVPDTDHLGALTATRTAVAARFADDA